MKKSSGFEPGDVGRMEAENTHRWGTDYCTAGLQCYNYFLCWLRTVLLDWKPAVQRFLPKR